VLPAAPFLIAISPAVWPLPYSFVSFDAVAACVSFAVPLEGFTPSLDTAGCSAVVVVVCSTADGTSFFA
jgi:hypothetical protein